MQTYITLIRGINVGGNKKVSMSALSKMFESLGFQKVRTYIQSGNVIFETEKISEISLSSKISTAIEKTFGFPAGVIIRTPEQMKSALKNCPFTTDDKNLQFVSFLSSKPTKWPSEKLEMAKAKDEILILKGCELYMHCPNGVGKSKLNLNLIEKSLGVSATMRNTRTVAKLLELSSN